MHLFLKCTFSDDVHFKAKNNDGALISIPCPKNTLSIYMRDI